MAAAAWACEKKRKVTASLVTQSQPLATVDPPHQRPQLEVNKTESTAGGAKVAMMADALSGRSKGRESPSRSPPPSSPSPSSLRGGVGFVGTSFMSLRAAVTLSRW